MVGLRFTPTAKRHCTVKEGEEGHRRGVQTVSKWSRGRVVLQAVWWVYTGPAPGGVDEWKPKTATGGHPEGPEV